jgi:hypothetical protein
MPHISADGDHSGLAGKRRPALPTTPDLWETARKNSSHQIQHGSCFAKDIGFK